MSLKGSLETVTLAGVLQLLCNEQKTGLLKVRNSEGDYQIIINEGNIVYAIESKKEARLGKLLIRDKKLSPETVAKSLEKARRKKQAFGKILVDEQHITKKTLHKYIYMQVEEILFNLFLHENGEFEYSDSTFLLKWLVMLKLNTVHLIIDALQRVDEVKKNL